VANATDSEGRPCCCICIGIDPGALIVENSPPDISGRTAQCTCCKKQVQSDFSLPFFEFGGIFQTSPKFQEYEEAVKALDSARKGPRTTRDEKDRLEAEVKRLCKECHATAELDGFYCGCMGWD